MLAEIIIIGDEILIGQIVDTNSAFISKELNKIGIQVTQITAVPDERNTILNTFQNATSRAQIVIITGGLGPTKDDVTKKTLCDFFDDKLVLNQEALTNVHELFEKHLKITPNKLNEQQAMVPSQAVVLQNKYGTAPGMWLEKNDVVFVSLPGVPYEMKALLQNEVVPRLQQRFQRPFIVHKTILTMGMGESAIAEIIEDWENNLPETVKLAYMPSLGRVRLRLSSKGTNESAIHAAIDQQVNGLKKLIGNIIVGYEGESSIEEVVANLLKARGKNLSTAESCTGGQIAKQMTIITGASQCFSGGVVTYATASKTKILGIPQSLILKYNVVSAEVAEAMALSVKKLYQTDYAVAATGIAGPDKGEGDKDIGTVYIGIATPERVFSEKFNFGNHRAAVIKRAANTALELLRKEILKN